MKQEIRQAVKLLENNGFKVIPPERQIISTFSFEKFWDLYNKKVDKPKCIALWNRLSEEDKKACMSYIPAYIASTPDKKYRRNPQTFLNNKTWNNEIIYTSNTSDDKAASRRSIQEIANRVLGSHTSNNF